MTKPHKLDPADIPGLVDKATKVLRDHPTWDAVRMYDASFLPNAYKWPARAERLLVRRDGNYRIESYDRKRSNGRGSKIARAVVSA